LPAFDLIGGGAALLSNRGPSAGTLSSTGTLLATDLDGGRDALVTSIGAAEVLASDAPLPVLDLTRGGAAVLPNG
jgi:hypothetical protein